MRTQITNICLPREFTLAHIGIANHQAEHLPIIEMVGGEYEDLNAI